MTTKEKRRGLGLDIRSFEGKDGRKYIVFKTSKDSQRSRGKGSRARNCGARDEHRKKTTHQLWGELWKLADS